MARVLKSTHSTAHYSDHQKRQSKFAEGGSVGGFVDDLKFMATTPGSSAGLPSNRPAPVNMASAATPQAPIAAPGAFDAANAANRAANARNRSESAAALAAEPVVKPRRTYFGD